jgi:hypothetical protein
VIEQRRPHDLAVPAHDQPIAVMLDLVQGPEGGLAARVGMPGVDEAIGVNAACKHPGQIAAGRRPVESSRCRGTATVGRRPTIVVAASVGRAGNLQYDPGCFQVWLDFETRDR